MSRYLLDTNILVFLISGDSDDISDETNEIITDYNNQLYTSSVAVSELMQLYRIKKIKTKKFKNATELHNAIEDLLCIKILPFTKNHTEILSKLKITDGHNDPFDHSIISQAISEKMILVSSDRKFEQYTSQKLLFSFNKR